MCVSQWERMNVPGYTQYPPTSISHRLPFSINYAYSIFCGWTSGNMENHYGGFTVCSVIFCAFNLSCCVICVRLFLYECVQSTKSTLLL